MQEALIKLICWLVITCAGINTNSVTPSQPVTDPGMHFSRVLLDEDEDRVPMRGHVQDISAHDISGVAVTLTRSGQSMPAYSDVTDSNGDYDLDSVLVGSYQLKFVAAGYYTKTVPLSITTAVNRTDTLIAK